MLANLTNDHPIKSPVISRISDVLKPSDDTQCIGSIRIVSKCIQAKSGDLARDLVVLNNSSGFSWSSSGNSPTYLAYHLKNDRGEVIVYDGIRTPLQDSVMPGKISVAPIYIKAPDRPGLYYLEVSLVQEGKIWLEDLGLKRWVTRLYVDEQMSQDGDDDLALRTRRIFAALKRAITKNNSEVL